MDCPCGKKASFIRCDPKQIVSGVGHVAVPRRYYACRHGGAKQTPWEAWAGLAGTHRVAPHARRMSVLPFDSGHGDVPQVGPTRCRGPLAMRTPTSAQQASRLPSRDG